MATRKTKSRKKRERRPVQHPKGRRVAPAPWRRYAIGGAVLAVVAGVAIGLATSWSGGTASRASGLPNTPDYHSLLVNSSNPQSLILGTHQGLYVSSDGGLHWRFDSLSESDAMNLVRATGQTIWLAGHEVFKKSTDGGTRWADVRPTGPKVAYVVGFERKLYRSTDGGVSWQVVGEEG